MADTPSPPLLRSGLSGLAVSVLVASLGTSAANVALPTIAVELESTFAQTQWVALAYLLGMTVASLTVGHLGDLLGRRKVLLAGTIVFTIAAALCTVAPTLWMLVLARAVQGIGAAVMMALPLARARDLIGPARLGAAMGLLGTTAAVGTAAGPALGGVLIAISGWPTIFALMALLGILSTLLVARQVETPLPPRSGRGLLGQLMAPSAVGPLLRIRAISVGAILNLIVGAVMMSTLIVGPFFLGGALHLSPAAIGAVMAAGPVASIITGVMAGRLVDRFGARRMTTSGLSAMITGSLVLALLPAWWGLPGYIAGTVLLAPGYQLFLAANSTGVLGATPAERRGAASGLLGLSRNLGLLTGASLLGALFAVASGPTTIVAASPDALLTGLRVTFLATAAALVIATALSALPARQAIPVDGAPHGRSRG
ncbi:MAG: MFS transporter [Candidatus Microbacterium colombiense]|nr:MAG: MFS transporter [Microbacterium sp.]